MLYGISAVFDQTSFSNQVILDALDIISARPPTTRGSPPSIR
jgi:hypothetical protein